MQRKLVQLLVFILTVSSITSIFPLVNAQDDITPPLIYFSIKSGSVLNKLGNFSVGFVIEAPTSENMIISSELDSVTYKASWETSIQAFQYIGDVKRGACGSTEFFFSVDLTNVPIGPQQIEVDVDAGGQNFGGGMYVGTFSRSASATLKFNIIEPPPSATVPDVQTIDTKGAGGLDSLDISAVAVDSDGNPHIAYTAFAYETTILQGEHFVDQSIPLVIYASWNGVAWSKQVVAKGSVNSFVLDDNNLPHILFNDGSGLNYAYWTGSKWLIRVVSGKGTSFRESIGALALDSIGNLHIAYTEGSNLKYATNTTGNSWDYKTIDNGVVSFPLSIAISKENIPFIFYGIYSPYTDILTRTQSTTETLKLATTKNSSWTNQTVPLSPPISGYGNIVLDSMGYPHFICSQSHFLENHTSEDTLLYVSWNGTDWNTQEVAADIQLQITNENSAWVNVGFLALDSQDNPYLTYTTNAGEIMYASKTSKDWNTRKVDTNISATAPSTLALDSNNAVHLSYYGHINQYYGYAGTIYFVDIMYFKEDKPKIAEPTPTPTLPPSEITSMDTPVFLSIAAVVIIGAFIVSFLFYRRYKNRKTVY